ncbi:PH domain-containing protein [Brachybacterium sp. YJGR34]|uniref:PH domain-containing protein n=1 Tax=Brachybacterium sp. YJGR34 TaxID=2059911 RepID=UPI000E0C7CCE|nr:PH domain-containing protein [Brachybacterium sp. YJGR34]
MSTSAPVPAPGDERAALVLRPRMVRLAAYTSAAVVLAGMIAGAVVIPGFTPAGRIGLLAIGVLVALFCHLEASVRVVARPEALQVRNLFRARTVAWPEIVGVSFPMGDPWAHLDLADGTTLSLHAIQRYDGERAIAAAHRLQELVHERGEAPQD